MQKLLPYFSFDGRTNRQRYWLTTLALVGLYIGGALVAAIFLVLPLIGPLIGVLVFLPIIVATIWAGLALATRRLHDRNKSVWWLLPMYLPLILMNGMGSVMSNSGGDDGAVLGLFFTVLGLPFGIWMLVELGCLKGTTGPNRFGEDPLNPAPVEVFA